MEDTPNPSNLLKLLQALMLENSSELDKINELTDESGPEELISAALKAYQKLQETPAGASEEFKNALFELIQEEAEKDPFYLNYPEISPAVFEFWAEAEDFEATNEYLRKTLYGMPHNALGLLYCYRNKVAPLTDQEALKADPALLFGENEYAALAKVMNPALVFRALHLVRAIKETKMFGTGAPEADAEVENGNAVDFELIEDLISAQFMQIYG